ncbi:MAG: pyridoxal-phosphate dependent enzyme, partial [Thermoleophilia bacterium]|nr:pyridoxal-phosphate dependent enzyme [Thermoleophilia bacterium]
WQQRRDFVSPVVPSGIAKSLAIGNPADGIFALDTARQTGGEITSVSEHEIVDGIRLLAETTGIFTETAGGVTTAALAKQATEGGMRPEERVVVYITGDGLKTLDAVASDLTTIDVEPTVSSLEEALRVAAPVGAQA